MRIRNEFNLLALFFVLAITPLAIYFSQQKQTTQQSAHELPPTVTMPTVVPSQKPLPTQVPTQASGAARVNLPFTATTFPTRPVTR